ncbi:MAG: class I adenylate-forming enzyme family protein [Steroidobacteraceae bacterium]
MSPSVLERQLALARRFPCWEPLRLDEMLDRQTASFPDRPYLITDHRVYSYRDIQSWSVQLANGLVAAGVKPGEHVALLMANYPEFVALKFAIARVGAVAVPINFLNRAAELSYVLQQSDAVLLITMDRFRDLDYLQALDEIAPDWESAGGGAVLSRLRGVVVFSALRDCKRPKAMTLDELCALETQAEFNPGAASSLSDIIYTSGTTGGPKGVLLTHDMLLRTAYASALARAFEDGRRVLFSLPLYHVFGYVEGMLSVLFVGGAIVPQLQFDPVRTVQALELHRASDVLMIPTMTLGVIEAFKSSRHDISSLRGILSSGAKSPPGIWEEIFAAFGAIEVTTGYGMTETTASTTVTRPDDPIERLHTTNGRMRDAGVAGDPALGDRLALYRVVDADSGIELPKGMVGELVVKGPSVTAGYYNKPEESAAAFDAQGWFRTGDLGVMDAEGYISLRGRKKECYRCGGEQVLPLEVEDVLIRHPAVDQAFVVPMPDRRMGEVGVAYVVMKAGCAASAAELIEHCAAQLARFKIPKHVVAITPAEVPVTVTGRPRKFLLAKRALEELAGS